MATTLPSVVRWQQTAPHLKVLSLIRSFLVFSTTLDNPMALSKFSTVGRNHQNRSKIRLHIPKFFVLVAANLDISFKLSQSMETIRIEIWWSSPKYRKFRTINRYFCVKSVLATFQGHNYSFSKKITGILPIENLRTENLKTVNEKLHHGLWHIHSFIRVRHPSKILQDIPPPPYLNSSYWNHVADMMEDRIDAICSVFIFL